MLVIRTLVKVETCSVLQKLKHLKKRRCENLGIRRGTVVKDPLYLISFVDRVINSRLYVLCYMYYVLWANHLFRQAFPS